MLLPGDVLWERYKVLRVGSHAARCAWLKAIPPPPSGARNPVPESGESTVPTHLLLACNSPHQFALAEVLQLLRPSMAPDGGIMPAEQEDGVELNARLPLLGEVRWRGSAADEGVAVIEVGRRTVLNEFTATLPPGRVLRLLLTLCEELQDLALCAVISNAVPARFYAAAAKLLNPYGMAAEASGERLVCSGLLEEYGSELRPPSWALWAAPEIVAQQPATAGALIFGMAQLARALLFGVKHVLEDDRQDLGDWGVVAANAAGSRDLSRAFLKSPRAAELPEDFRQVLARSLKTRSATRQGNLERFRAALLKLTGQDWAQRGAGEPMPMTVAKLPAASPPPNMVVVPAGPYLSGEKKTPRTLRAFAIDVLPVTEKDFKEYLAATKQRLRADGPGSRPAKFDKHPVVNVTWHEAEEYAAHHGKRIPTVFEWEKAARGVDGRKFPYGDTYTPNTGKLRVSGTTGTAYKDAPKEPDPVGSYPNGSSPFKVQDMAGNILEWTSTARRQGERIFRAIKGACFLDGSVELSRCSSLQYRKPDAREAYLGFRCVQDLDAPVPDDL